MDRSARWFEKLGLVQRNPVSTPLPASVSSSQTSHHVPGLDGIRGLAIALVLLSHAATHNHFSFLGFVAYAGNGGVNFFFVLSGFLITSLLLREEERTGTINLRLFYLRRALRLFPALWLYLLALAVLSVAGLLPLHPWHSILAALLYIRNLVGQGHETGHLWSLAVEEHFYVLWPLLFIALRGRNRARLMLCLAGILAVTAWRTYATAHQLFWEGVLYGRSDFRFDGPLFGCALALAARIYPKVVQLFHSSALRSGLVEWGVLGVFLSWNAFRLLRFMPNGLDTTFMCVLGAILVLSQVGETGEWSLLRTRPLLALGQISYGVYLWQQLFLGPEARGLTFVRSFPFDLVACLVIPTLSYFVLEKPLLRLKDRKFHTASL